MSRLARRSRRSRLPLAGFCLAFVATRLVAQPVSFAEIGQSQGVSFRQRSGANGQRYLPETMGGGLALFDYDRDGDLDLLLVDGGSIDPSAPQAGRSTLYRNDSTAFVDVTERAGIVIDGYGMGAVAGDVDGDDDLDLYLTAFGDNALLRNRGDGSFATAPQAGGAQDPRWSTGASFLDGDLDGDLDLYVVAYVDFTVGGHKRCGDPRTGIEVYCGPDVYSPLPDRYFENDGRGSFTDATTRSGVGAPGNGLGVCASDLDDDGRPDLYVANDLTPNFLWHNRGNGTFEEIGLLAGTALGDRGRAEAGMGIDVGDLDGDGRWEIAVTNYEGESLALYSLRGERLFTDRRYLARLAEPTLRPLSFGLVLADLDLDGDLDLALANGHVRDNAAEVRPGSTFAQPNQVLLNDGSGRFAEVHDAAVERVAVSRGLAAGDLDLDGDLDLVISNLDDRPDVLDNRSGAGSPGRFVVVEIAGSSPPPVGTRIELLVAGKAPQRRELRSGCSYLSQGELAAHFGVGSAPLVTLVIRWTDGTRRRVEALRAGHRFVVWR